MRSIIAVANCKQHVHCIVILISFFLFVFLFFHEENGCQCGATHNKTKRNYFGLCASPCNECDESITCLCSYRLKWIVNIVCWTPGSILAVRTQDNSISSMSLLDHWFTVGIIQIVRAQRIDATHGWIRSDLKLYPGNWRNKFTISSCSIVSIIIIIIIIHCCNYSQWDNNGMNCSERDEASKKNNTWINTAVHYSDIRECKFYTHPRGSSIQRAKWEYTITFSVQNCNYNNNNKKGKKKKKWIMRHANGNWLIISGFRPPRYKFSARECVNTEYCRMLWNRIHRT